jgi:hypothetical protein
MLKSICAAIGTALKGAVSFLRAIVAVPGRAVAQLLGGGAPEPPDEDSPLVEDLARRVAAEDAAAEDNYRKIAAAVWHWCIDSLLADGPIAAPKWLPRGVREWLPGLDAVEAERIVAANKDAVRAHLYGLYAIPGVRKVQRLPAVAEWPPEPIYKDPSPGFLHFATYGGAGPTA